MTPVTIGGIPIGDGHPCRIVCEIGTNHQGDVDLAKWLARTAKDVGCDFVKLQVRTPMLAVPEAEWDDVRDTPWGKMGKLEYRRKVELSDADLISFNDFCEAAGIPWFTSVWDIQALERLHGLPIDFIAVKIPSARLHDDELLRRVARYGRPVILSTGMSEWVAVKRAWSILRDQFDADSKFQWRRMAQIIPMQCTSAYPARHDESNLRVIQTYKHEFGGPVGFSSHKIGIATCLLAVAVGANLIERHITWDRSAKGSDHRMSSTGEDLKRLVQEIRYAEACLGTGAKRIEQSEMAEAVRLRGSA